MLTGVQDQWDAVGPIWMQNRTLGPYLPVLHRISPQQMRSNVPIWRQSHTPEDGRTFCPFILTQAITGSRAV
jgi:hypothetical protein